MIIRKIEDYFLIRIYKESIGEFNIFDKDDIKDCFQKILNKIQKKYNLRGLVEVDVYVNLDYGMIIEIHPICNYFNDIDMRIHIHLDSVFLVNIDTNHLLDYDDVYYYKEKFYGTYPGVCDNEVFYKDTEDIINKGIKIC